MKHNRAALLQARSVVHAASRRRWLSQLSVGASSMLLSALTWIASGASLVLPNAAYAQSTSAVVGASAGSFGVSPMGAATYHMPLTLPPGVAGIMPSLGLDYSSRGGDLFMGPGWSIGGLSQISRCPNTYAQDGQTLGITFTSSDRFCLDGQQLVTNGTYGAIGTAYRTEVETFSNIVSSGGTVGSPAYFTVKTKAGMTMTYGKTYQVNNSGGLTYIWLLDSSMDTSGNAINYTYTISNGDWWPATITYGGNTGAGTSPSITVSFSWATRTGYAPNGFVDGVSLDHTQSLSRIDTEVSGAKVRHWKMAYSQTTTSRDTLASVTECAGADESQCFNPTQFTWNPAIGSYSSQARSVSMPGYGTGNTQPLLTGDVNNDGVADLLSPILNPSTGAATVTVVLDGAANSAGTTYSLPGTYLPPNNDWAFGAGDFNGDGRTDLALAWVDSSGNYDLQTFISNGSSFTSGTSTSYPASSIPNSFTSSLYSNEQILVGDFNGDGLPDVIFLGLHRQQVQSPPQYIYYWGYVTFLSSASSPGTFTLGPIGAMGPDGAVVAADVNGDGLTDLVEVSSSEAIVYLNTGGGKFSSTTCAYTGPNGTYHILPLDVNGDGNADVVAVAQNGSTGTIYTFLSKGDGTLTNPIITSVPLSNGDQRNIVVGDFNGDGLQDIAWVDQGTTPVIDLSLSLGNGSYSTAAMTGLSASFPSTHLDYVADFSGSGVDSIFSTNGASATLETSQGAPFLRLASIQDGLGARVGISYAPTTSSSVYADDGGGLNGFPNVPMRTAQYVVSQADVLNPGSNDRLTNYNYVDSRFNMQGRGFLGFAEVQATDVTTNGNTTKQVTDYLQGFPYIGAIKDGYTVDTSTNLMLGRIDNTWTAATESFNSYFPYVSSSQTRGYEINSSAPYVSSSSAYTYDTNYGNLTVSTSTAYTGDIGATPSYTRQESRTIYNDTADWILDRVTGTSVTRSASNASSITRTTSYNYSSAGLLVEETLEPSDTGTAYLDTTYGRDGFGNIKYATVSGYQNNLAQRTETYGYSSDGRFLSQDCNALSQCTNRTFDPNTGNVLTSTDPNGFVINYGYDSFGRLANVSVNQAGVNASSAVTRFWCSGSSLCSDAATSVFGTEVTTSDGSASVSAFDADQRQVRKGSLNGDGIWIEALSQYDMEGRLSATTPPQLIGTSNPYWTTVVYDELNRPKKIVAPSDEKTPAGSVVGYTYNGLSTTITDPRGNVSTRVKTATGSVASVTDAAGGVMSFSYDAFDDLTGTTDPNNRPTSISYDVRGRKTGISDPAIGAWSYGYDSLGELVSQTDPKNQIINLTYDLIGRLTSRTAPDYSYSWTWDKGNWIGAVNDAHKSQNSNGATVYDRSTAYTGFGAVSAEAETIGSGVFNTNYAYDNQGRISGMTYPSGLALSIGYNAYGEESSIAQTGTGGMVFWAAQDWDQWDEVHIDQLGNGVAGTATRDDAVGTINQQTAQLSGGAAVASLLYQWDPNSNTTFHSDAISNRADSPGYDPVNRLNSDAVAAGGTTTTSGVTYDGIGNIKTKTNSNGNFFGSRTYSWTGENQLSQVADGFLGQAIFQYDADDGVMSQSSTQSGATTTTLYLAGGLSENVSNGSGTTWNDYIPTPGGTIAMVVQSPTQSDTVQFLHRDSSGSIVSVSDGSGALIQRYTYDANGRRTTTYTAPGYSGLLTDHGFTGHLQIDAFNLIHMQGRVYDASVARFLQGDPIIQAPENSQSYNRYVYVLNNPLTLIDPSGFQSLSQTYDYGDDSLLQSLIDNGVTKVVPVDGSSDSSKCSGSNPDSSCSGLCIASTGCEDIQQGSGVLPTASGSSNGAPKATITDPFEIGQLLSQIGNANQYPGSITPGAGISSSGPSTSGVSTATSQSIAPGASGTGAPGGNGGAAGDPKSENGADTVETIAYLNAGQTIRRFAVRAGIIEIGGGGPPDAATDTAATAVLIAGATIAAVQAAKPVINQIKMAISSVHGNSLSSQRETAVYELRSLRTNQLLKYGITSQADPEDRYSSTFYLKTGSRMDILAIYNNRALARAHEFGLCSGYAFMHGGALPPLSGRC
jgi:RHS repeat-associated protein